MLRNQVEEEDREPSTVESMRGIDENVNIAFSRQLSVVCATAWFNLYAFPKAYGRVRVLRLAFFTFRRSVCSWNLAWKVDDMTEIGSATMTTPLTHAMAPTALPRPVAGTMSPYPIVQSVITAHHMECGILQTRESGQQPNGAVVGTNRGEEI
jgi:hypothetical protein